MAGMIDNSSAPQYVTRQEIGSILDDWYAKKQPLKQEGAEPNKNVYTATYDGQAAAPQQSAAPQPQSQPQQSMYQQPQNYGFRPYMGGYGMQTPFSGYGMMAPFGGMQSPFGGYGGYGGYGQMYNPFSMY